MLKKISLMGILVFSFGVVYSAAEAPSILVEDEPRASSPSSRTRPCGPSSILDALRAGVNARRVGNLAYDNARTSFYEPLFRI